MCVCVCEPSGLFSSVRRLHCAPLWPVTHSSSYREHLVGLEGALSRTFSYRDTEVLDVVEDDGGRQLDVLVDGAGASLPRHVHVKIDAQRALRVKI